MKVTPQSKILREDVKDAPSWIDVILLGLNTLIQTFYNLVDKNIDDSNIRCQIKVITFTTLPSYPVLEPIKFPNTLKVNAASCTIQQCTEKIASGSVGIATYNPGWSESNKTIIINSILGLQANKTYTISFRIT